MQLSVTRVTFKKYMINASNVYGAGEGKTLRGRLKCVEAPKKKKINPQPTPTIYGRYKYVPIISEFIILETKLILYAFYLLTFILFRLDTYIRHILIMLSGLCLY